MHAQVLVTQVTPVSASVMLQRLKPAPPASLDLRSPCHAAEPSSLPPPPPDSDEEEEEEEEEEEGGGSEEEGEEGGGGEAGSSSRANGDGAGPSTTLRLEEGERELFGGCRWTRGVGIALGCCPGRARAPALAVLGVSGNLVAVLSCPHCARPLTPAEDDDDEEEDLEGLEASLAAKL